MEIEKSRGGFVLKTYCPVDTIHDKYNQSFPLNLIYLSENDLEQLFHVVNKELIDLTLGKENA